MHLYVHDVKTAKTHRVISSAPADMARLTQFIISQKKVFYQQTILYVS
jgi:hypothetical protein